MEANEKQFIKAFNDGYLLSKHEPELLNAILQGDRSNTPYIQAMALGKEQYDKDKAIDEKAQVKGRYPSWLTGDRSNRNDPEPDRDKDKDLDRDIEPER